MCELHTSKLGVLWGLQCEMRHCLVMSGYTYGAGFYGYKLCAI